MQKISEVKQRTKTNNKNYKQNVKREKKKNTPKIPLNSFCVDIYCWDWVLSLRGVCIPSKIP